ncbi:MAG: hypothetical protein B6D64_11575 [Bacteroidetes bacterium 4484_276]|nr:MAG: hypothetical protein B6D64_11575 [Bacteroidetes bacterium 4484_276]
MLIRYIAVLLLGFMPFTSALAQAPDKVQRRDKGCAYCKAGEHTNENPYVRGFKHELPFIATGAGLLTTGFVLQAVNPTQPFTIPELDNLNRDDINPFDRPASYNYSPQAAKTSDIIRLGVLILPAIFLSNHHTRPNIGSLLVMGLEVGAITYGLTLTVKNIANRPRPYVYNTDVPVDERTNDISKKSFFSGHASFTASFSFFTAKVISDYHPNMKTGLKIAVWSTAAIIPAVTGYLRVESGKHFPTDVITGYAIGAFAGWIVPQLHKKKKRNVNYSLIPVMYRGAPGLYFRYKL